MGSRVLISIVVVVVVVCIAAHALAGSERRTHRKYSICVPDDIVEYLTGHESTLASNTSALDVVAEPDDLACLESVAAGETDCYLIADKRVLFAAAYKPELDALRLFMNVTEERETRNRRSYGVVVRRSANVTSPYDLRGRRASFATTHGDIHVWFYMKLKRLGLLTDRIDPSKTLTENVLEQLSKYLSSACLTPRIRPKSSAGSLRRMLDTKYRSLRAACGDRTPLSTWDGADTFELLRLTTNDVDVAFTTVHTAQTFLANVSAQYEFLCVDDTTRQLDSASPCAWFRQPGRQFVTNPQKVDSIDELRRSVAQFSADLGEQIANEATRLSTYENPIRPRAYLEDTGLDSAWIPRRIDGHTLRTFEVCVVGDANAERCRRVSNMSYYSNYRPEFVCVARNTTEECLEYVRCEGGVHAIDPYYYDVAREKYRLRAIAVSAHGDNEPSGTVALIRTDSNVTTWEDLRGSRSCHTALESNAGLVAPLHVLRERGLIRTPVCPAVNAISEFFSGGSCLPGAGAVDGSSEKLCALCAGDVDGQSAGGADKCAADLSEAYYGDVGALRCLFERRGDVAFVEIARLPSVDETPGLEWTKGVRPEDFEVLTLNDKRFSIAECFRNVDQCTLIKQLLHVFVTKSDTPDAIVQGMKDCLGRKACWSSDCRDLYALYDTYHDDRAYKFSHTERLIDDFDDHVSIADAYEKILKQVKSC